MKHQQIKEIIIKAENDNGYEIIKDIFVLFMKVLGGADY